MVRQKQDVPDLGISYSAQRVGIFIDVQNMYYSAKNLYGAKANFINIVKEAVGERQLVRAIAYVVETPQQHEVRFLDALRLQGIELKERDLQVFAGGAKKADWDVGIAVDAIAISEILDTIILVSGDGDYLPLVEYLQNHGRRVEVMAFRSTSSSKLVELVDKFVDLGEHQNKFLIRGGDKPVTGHDHPHEFDEHDAVMDKRATESEKAAAAAAQPARNPAGRTGGGRRRKRTIM